MPWRFRGLARRCGAPPGRLNMAGCEAQALQPSLLACSWPAKSQASGDCLRFFASRQPVSSQRRFAPDLAKDTNAPTQKRNAIARDWLVLLRQPAFARVVLAAALVLGSHAMHDAFAIIRWRDAGISAAVSSVLWSESVAAEVL